MTDLSSVAEGADPEETELLVTRMLEMVNKEKEMYGMEKGAEEGEQREEEIRQMDTTIVEKEDILHKLMETVKGYGHMKADFERLLDEIGE